jgi:hypothetical protein
MKRYVAVRALTVIAGLALAVLPGLTLMAAASSPASRSTGDLCTLTIRPAAPPDGPYNETLSVSSNGFTLDMSIEGLHRLQSGRRGKGAFYMRISDNYWQGQVYVYRHGNAYHACGVGMAIANAQTTVGSPFYKHFSLNETAGVKRTQATLRLGKRTFVFSGKTHYR